MARPLKKKEKKKAKQSLLVLPLAQLCCWASLMIFFTLVILIFNSRVFFIISITYWSYLVRHGSHTFFSSLNIFFSRWFQVFCLKSKVCFLKGWFLPIASFPIVHAILSCFHMPHNFLLQTRFSHFSWINVPWVAASLWLI